MHKKSDIVETALAANNFSTLATALGAAGLIETFIHTGLQPGVRREALVENRFNGFPGIFN